MCKASLSCSRREFCKKMSLATLSAGAAACGLESCSTRLDEKFSTITVNITQPAYAALQQPTGIAYVEANLAIVYCASQGVYYAFSSVCTHAGCQLPIPSGGFLPADGVITCGCHGAQFSTKGLVLKGPAERNLPTYYTMLSGNFLTVSTTPPNADTGISNS